MNVTAQRPPRRPIDSAYTVLVAATDIRDHAAADAALRVIVAYERGVTPMHRDMLTVDQFFR